MAENGDVGELPAVVEDSEDKKRRAQDDVESGEFPDAKRPKFEEVDIQGPAPVIDEYVIDGLQLYDMHRKPRETTTEMSKTVSFEVVAPELTCYLCEGPFTRPFTVMECLHRFCFDCVSKYLRIGRKDCPRCGVKLPSTRFMRPDHAMELLLSFVCPASSRPAKSVCLETLERRIPLIAERHAAGPLPRFDDLDPFAVPDQFPTTSSSKSANAQGKKRNSQGKSATSAAKRGRPPKAAKAEGAKDGPILPAAAPPPPAVHVAPAVIKMAAPMPAKGTGTTHPIYPTSSTPPAGSVLPHSPVFAALSSSKPTHAIKSEGGTSTEGAHSSTQSENSPHHHTTSPKAQTLHHGHTATQTIAHQHHQHHHASGSESNTHTTHHVSTGAVSTAALKEAAKSQQHHHSHNQPQHHNQQPSATSSASNSSTALSSHPTNSRKPRRTGTEQLSITLLPMPATGFSASIALPGAAVSPLSKPFIIAPSHATLEHLSLLIGSSVTQSESKSPIEASTTTTTWKFSSVTNTESPLDNTLSLDWVNKNIFVPNHQDIILYFFRE